MTIESAFWRWFSLNEARLFEFENELEACFDALSQELCKVHPALTFEFGPVKGGMREFVLSAGGDRDAFPSVEALFAARPSLTRFAVTRFRPRRQPMDIEYAELRINADDVYFRLAKDKDQSKVGVLLFLPGYSTDQETDFGQVGFLFLDEALGEYDVETKVGFVEILGHDSRHFKGASPLTELAARCDAVFASRNQHG